MARQEKRARRWYSKRRCFPGNLTWAFSRPSEQLRRNVAFSFVERTWKLALSHDTVTSA
jgi:hypothetical protein